MPRTLGPIRKVHDTSQTPSVTVTASIRLARSPPGTRDRAKSSSPMATTGYMAM